MDCLEIFNAVRIHDEIRKVRLSLFQGSNMVGNGVDGNEIQQQSNKDRHLFQSTPMKLQIEKPKVSQNMQGLVRQKHGPRMRLRRTSHTFRSIYTYNRALMELLEQNCHDSKNARSKCKFAAAI